MTSKVITENMFDTLSEEVISWSEKIQNTQQDSIEDKDNHLVKIGPAKNGKIKYVVHNRYIPETKRILTEAFTTMSNKDTVAKKLEYTKACNFTLKNPTTGVYGTCYRSVCTFAHSLEELVDPMCEFDTVCRYKYGRYTKDGVFDKTLKCLFRHSNETREDWIQRTGKTLPDLPLKKSGKLKEKALGGGYTQKTNPSTPPTRININPPNAPVKPTIKRENIEHKAKKNLIEDFQKSSKKSCEQQGINIIKVPSEELAKLAIKSAFEHGVFNIQVIIE